MPEGTIQETFEALTERFRKTTSADFLPKVSFVKTGFRLGGDTEQVSGLGGGANQVFSMRPNARYQVPNDQHVDNQNN
jgi:hypothetical protein